MENLDYYVKSSMYKFRGRLICIYSITDNQGKSPIITLINEGHDDLASSNNIFYEHLGRFVIGLHHDLRRSGDFVKINLHYNKNLDSLAFLGPLNEGLNDFYNKGL